MKRINLWAAILTAVIVGWMAAPSATAYTNEFMWGEDFESYPNLYPLVDGNVPYFYASSTSAVVQAGEVPPGATRSAMIPEDVTLSNTYAVATPTNLMLQLAARLVRFEGAGYPAVDTNATALFYVDSNGYFVAYDGNAEAWYTASGAATVDENTWITNLNVYLDFGKRTWSLGTNGTMLVEDIGFANTNIGAMNGFDIYNGGGSKTSYVDLVAIYDQIPVPDYTVAPSGLTNSAIEGKNAPDQTFNVIGTGEGSMNYTITTNGNSTWLSVDNGSGTVTDQNTNVITVLYNTAALPVGIYNDTFSIGSAIKTQTVDVTLNVVAFLAEPGSFQDSKLFGYAPGTQALVFTQSETGLVTITTNAPTPWLSVNPGEVSGLSNDIAITYVTNGLEVGTHTAQLHVGTARFGGYTQTVDVAVTVYSRPVLETGWAQHIVTIHKGQQPADTNVTIRNLAGAPRTYMSYGVTSSAPWLLVQTNDTCTNDELQVVQVPFADMTTNVGTFNAQLDVTAVDAGGFYTPSGVVTQTAALQVQVNIIAPGVPGGVTASDGTVTNGIQVGWSATTNVAYYQLWRANTNDLGQAALLANNLTNLNYSDLSVDPGLRRWYWVRVINPYGGDGEFSTPDDGYRFLPAPTGLTASQADTNKCAITWVGSFGAVTYEIWRSEFNNVGLATKLNEVPSATTTYNDTTGIADKTYYYWVRACTPDMGSFSASVAGKRAALAKPGKPTASDGTFSTKVRVTWNVLQGAAQYEVWRHTSNNSAGATKLTTVSTLAYDDTGATAGQMYYYWIKGKSAQGTSPFSDPDTGWRKLPAPGSVAATKGTRPYSVRVSWAAVPNATSYEVTRASAPGIGALAQQLAEVTPYADGAPSLVEGTLALSETTALFYDDNATVAGTPYSYTVRAKNALGAGDYSGSVSGFRQRLTATTAGPVMGDYDGDRMADLILFDTATGQWRALLTSIGEFPLNYGNATCMAVWGNYDGDMFSDPMIFSAAGKYLRVMMSASGYAEIRAAPFGAPGDVQAAADYDGDRKTDPATFNKTTGRLTAFYSGSGYAASAWTFAAGSDYEPVSADFDGDRRADPAIYSASASMLKAKLTTAGYGDVALPLGKPGARFVRGDVDNDGLADIGTYKEATGTLSIMASSMGYATVALPFGGPGYTTVVNGDFDGDGLNEVAVYGPTKGWMVLFSSRGYAAVSDSFRGATAVPVGP